MAKDCVIKHRLPAINLLLSAITRDVSHNEPPERSPFKVAREAAQTEA